MNIIPGFYYSKNDEWVEVKGNKATVGITDYAQNSLSDIVFVEISVSEGDPVEASDLLGTVESVKAASDVYTPVAGIVAATNEAVIDNPELINTDPFGKAWLIQVENENGIDTSGLMNAEEYKTYCEGRG